MGEPTLESVAVINYTATRDYAAMLPELAGRLHVFSQNAVAGDTSGFATYEVIENSEEIPYAELRIRQLARHTPISRILTDNEYDLERAAHLRDDLGLPGQSGASALAFRDKLVMKQTARQAVPVPAFAPLERFADLLAFIEEHAYPVVVKPVKLAGSRDVSVLRDEADLVAFAHRPWREDLMVEDFVPGQIFAVDAVISEGYRFVSASRYLRDCLGVLEGRHNGHLLLHPEDPFAIRLAEFLDQVLSAFEVPPVGAYHLEVFHTPDDGLVLCEIASRIAGSRLPALTRATYGLDLHTAWFRLSCGLPVDPPPATPPALLHGSVSITPQGRAVRAPGRPPFPWVHEYTVNEGLALGAHPSSSSAYLCFAIVSGRDFAEVEARVQEVEDWIMANLVPVDRTGSDDL
ncbi:ATP-grasp domain-containing protein [Streptacidiphilus jiangxiensis]|uniref:ATP-grasp domain-containing protein n=1 Tax=Streptacidiphilus jiangxiensis TaxID=235985 RepID=A0A1H7VL70_STRJI|nr:hypothetical protein [Streptacidiphilus jiangxiensis]SEM09910.1 hypothetical protein SAMN05414137_118111 [Streptacidiphilus jiangxiensis]